MKLFMVLYDGIYQGQVTAHTHEEAADKFTAFDRAAYPQMRIGSVRVIPTS